MEQNYKKHKEKTINLRTFRQILYISYDNDLDKEYLTITSQHGHKLNNFRKYNSFDFDGLNIEQYSGYQEDVAKELEKKNFDGYSMVYILLAANPFSITTLTDVMNLFYAIQKNKTMRFVTKIIHCPFLDEFVLYEHRTRISPKAERERKEFWNCFEGCENTVLAIGISRKQDIIKSGNYMDRKSLQNIFPQKVQYNLRLILHDFVKFFDLPIQNHYIQFHLPIGGEIDTNSTSIFYNIYLPKIFHGYYVSDMKRPSRTNTVFCEVHISQKYQGNYVFAINPALSLFLYNFTIAEKSETRVGAEKDLELFKSTFDKLRIPQLIVQDGSKEAIDATMEKGLKFIDFKIENIFVGMSYHFTVKTMDLSVLKYLFLTISSHGIEGDQILTRTGSYHVYDDIIKRLKSNPTLKNTLIIVLVNACRGEFDYQFSMEDETPPNFPKTDTENWDENLVLWFSTQKGCVSYRTLDGTIFLQEFLEKLNDIKQPKTINNLALEIDNKMKEKLKRIKQYPELLYNTKKEHTFKVILESMLKYHSFLDQLKCVVADLNLELN